MKEKIKCYCGHTTTCECGPEEPKQETLEEAAQNYAVTKTNRTSHLIGFREGAKWQQERSYSEEEVIEILLNFRAENPRYIEEFLEQFKKK